MRDLLLSDIISYFDDDIIEIKGVITDKIIKYIKPIGKEDEYSLDWINPTNENGQSFAEQTKAKAIICNNSIEYSVILQHECKVLIVAENPKLLLAKIYQKFFKIAKRALFMFTSGAFGLTCAARLNACSAFA
jgi:UDP-3-O-[3-hydroxymyristoyl] glucosamine N-acyltransferase